VFAHEENGTPVRAPLSSAARVPKERAARIQNGMSKALALAIKALAMAITAAKEKAIEGPECCQSRPNTSPAGTAESHERDARNPGHSGDEQHGLQAQSDARQGERRNQSAENAAEIVQCSVKTECEPHAVAWREVGARRFVLRRILPARRDSIASMARAAWTFFVSG